MELTMRNIWTITKRELSAYFGTPLAYVFIVIFVALTGAFAFYIGALFERGRGGSPVLLYLSSLVVSDSGSGHLHAFVGRRKKIRNHRTPDDLAG